MSVYRNRPAHSSARARLFLVMVYAVLLGCSESPVRKSFQFEELIIKWIPGWPADGARGTADLDPANKRCVVKVPEPEHQYDEWAERIMGHEVFHCFYGEYHDSIGVSSGTWRF